MIIENNVSLKPYNTFGIAVKTAFFAECKTVEDLLELISTPTFKNNPTLILGGGSNILFTKDYEGLVIKNSLNTIKNIKETDQNVYIKAGAGINWHEFVLYCVDNSFAGIENLSLIPGTIGACPIQNIGAYGVEVKDVVHEVESIEIATGKPKIFSNQECNFGYRDSVFKNIFKNQYIITSVTFRLNKNPQFNISYGDIQKTLENNKIDTLSIKVISDAVVEIRNKKLPNPKEIGNCGSFFKNPIVDSAKVDKLKIIFPNISYYPIDGNSVKVAAGWLIEQCGWKGKRVGNTGSHAHQALVLVNYGNATGNEVWQLALAIQHSVWEKFGIEILPEVNVM